MFINNNLQLLIVQKAYKNEIIKLSKLKIIVLMSKSNTKYRNYERNYGAFINILCWH